MRSVSLRLILDTGKFISDGLIILNARNLICLDYHQSLTLAKFEDRVSSILIRKYNV
jgi:hypothetical protein